MKNRVHRCEISKTDVFVANGEMGVVTEAHSNRTTVQFDLPPRTVTFPRGGGDDDNGGKIDLAYACTVHKFQGSEAPFVVVGVSSSRHATAGICDRSWIFTAISRARRACFLVGRRDEIDVIAKRDYRNDRKTLLTHIIKEAADNADLKP